MKWNYFLPMLIFLEVSCADKDPAAHAVNSNPWQQDKNIYLKNLQLCSLEPMTGFLRNGYCHTTLRDDGVHTVCAILTRDFLEYTLEMGNDLMSEKPGFPGLKPGDRWCICAEWWRAAELKGLAPLVDPDASQFKSLEFISKEKLEEYGKRY